MTIKITVPASPDTTFVIHRGLERDELTELTQLAPGVSEYVDEDVELRTLYYYRIDAKTEDDYVYGTIKTHAWHQERGLGPAEIALGDWELGYFGTINAEELWGSTQPLYFTSIGLTASQFGTISLFHKFAWEGKIIYVPDRPFGYVTGVFSELLQNFYINRLLYPVGFPDEYRDPILTGPTVEQGDHVTINGYNYIVSNVGLGNPKRTPRNSTSQMALSTYLTNSLWVQIRSIYGFIASGFNPTQPGDRGVLDCFPPVSPALPTPATNNWLMRWDASSYTNLVVGQLNQPVPNSIAPTTSHFYEFLGYLELKS